MLGPQEWEAPRVAVPHRHMLDHLPTELRAALDQP